MTNDYFFQDDQIAKRPRMASMWPESWEALAATDRSHYYDLREVPEGCFVSREREVADTDSLVELVRTSETGIFQMSELMGQWERRQANAVSELRQQLETLNMQRLEAEIKYKSIMEPPSVSRTSSGVFPAKPDVEDPVCPMDEDGHLSSNLTTCQRSSAGSVCTALMDDEENSLEYWKDRAEKTGHLLAESLQREEVLVSKLKENGVQPTSSAPLEELQNKLNRLDNFLHFTLRKAPVVIAHQDADLRYKFVFNPFPGLSEEAILGKADAEIVSGPGIDESIEFKREVMKRGKPMQRQFEFSSELFGQKTFIMSVEPVMGRSGETLGINYVALDVTEEAARQEKVVCRREEAAVLKSVESEMNRTLLITEEAMRAKQMLATMSHEIRSPLSGVVSIAEILATTKLDAEQRSMVDIMNASGEHVLELINDILDLSKALSGAMTLEGKKFRPRLVLKNVLQVARASAQRKDLSLSASVDDNVPEEVVGDVLRIRQILTNLISNAVKFTPKGEILVKLQLVSPPGGSEERPSTRTLPTNHLQESVVQTSASERKETPSETTVSKITDDPKNGDKVSDIPRSLPPISTGSTFPSGSLVRSKSSTYSTRRADEAGISPSFPDIAWDLSPKTYQTTEEIWLHCDVCDSGIGIPDEALPSLFEEYTQVSTTIARKYGGTGLGLAICKQLVRLMGGKLEVSSKVNVGSTFSFSLPVRTVKNVANQASRRSTPFTPSYDGHGRDLKVHSEIVVDKPGLPAWVVVDEDIPILRDGDNATSSSNTQLSHKDSSESIHSSPEDPRPGSVLATPAKTYGSRKGSNGLKIIAPATSSAQRVPATSSQSGAANSRSPRILLAEDNNVNVLVAKSMLKRLGHSLEVVYNGAEAVQALRRGAYDLVLMDVSMPVMDGLEATRLIRKSEEECQAEISKGQLGAPEAGTSDIFPSDKLPRTAPDATLTGRTPIIALTANAMADNVAECYHNGMDSFIAKPITFEKLEQVLNQYIPWAEHHRIQER